MSDKSDEIKDNKIFKEIVHSMFKIDDLKKAKSEIEQKYEEQVIKFRDIERKKETVEAVLQNKKKLHKMITMLCFSLLIITIVSLAVFFIFDSNTSKQLNENNFDNLYSSYNIQNLRGDIIDTWAYWPLDHNQELVINIIGNTANQKKFDIIKNVILSHDRIKVDNSAIHAFPIEGTSGYYLGWAGALDSISNSQTKYEIPKKFRVIQSEKEIGNIIIRLTELKNGDGYSGYTKSIVEDKQILKSYITIYNISELDDKKLEIIVRHEFGHALGLIHSSDPDDLMHPVILTDYPYISECALEAIQHLYNLRNNTSFICSK